LYLIPKLHHSFKKPDQNSSVTFLERLRFIESMGSIRGAATMDRDIPTPELHVYSYNERSKRIHNPTALTVLDWLRRLDGRDVSALFVANPNGWLDIGIVNEQVTMCYCDYALAICRSEIVSWDTAIEQVLFFTLAQECQPIN
jgi:hypothetical protein